MKLSNSAQMRELDRYAIEELGISGTKLMTRAAEHIAEAAIKELSGNGHASVFCGIGNNGGDGLGAAAILKEKGYTVRVFLIGEEERMTKDSQKMHERLKKSGGKTEEYTPSAETDEYIKGSRVIIDAIYGIGLNTKVKGIALEAVERINETEAYVIAADIPSGVEADSGRVLGSAVRADKTVTFTMAKPGHFVQPGCIYTGELQIRDIGIPYEVVAETKSDTYAVMPEEITLPQRRQDAHKGNFGKCVIIAGSMGYTGAPVLSARAATRSGAGLVYLGVPNSVYQIMAVKCDEEMPFPLPDETDGKLTSEGAAEIIRRAAICDTVLVGMGLGRSREITNLIESMLKGIKKPVIIDADGINAVAGNIDVLDEAACPLVLTPHDGEFARISDGLRTGDRLKAAREFAKARGCVLVLKGHGTLTALPTGEVYINTTGGPAMAKGGSGDVLSGVIAALIGQGFPIKDAVIAGVYLHGLAGDICAERLGEYSVTASDIIDEIPEAFKRAVRKRGKK